MFYAIYVLGKRKWPVCVCKVTTVKINDFPIFLKCQQNIFADLIDLTVEKVRAISPCLMTLISSYFFLSPNSAGLVVTTTLIILKKNPVFVKSISDEAVKLLTWLTWLKFESWVHVFLMLSDEMESACKEPLWLSQNMFILRKSNVCVES